MEVNIELIDFGKDFTEWLQIVKNEVESENNRSVVIVCASILDTQLEKLLKNVLYIDKNIDENLFLGSNAILSSFSSKITMAYYLKIISENEMKLLNEIRKIRNMFAHEIDISKGRISDAIKDRCLNLEIPKGMYVPIEAFIGDINQIDLDYNPNSEKEPMKRFINTFFCLSQYLFLHNLEFIDILETNNSAYNMPKPYEFLEKFKDLLCQENDFILEHLQKCMERAKSERNLLQDILYDFQDGDTVEFRNKNINTKDEIKEYIEILEKEYIDFEDELKHRQLKNVGGEEKKETLFGNAYESTCESINALSAMIDKIKRISK